MKSRKVFVALIFGMLCGLAHADDGVASQAGPASITLRDGQVLTAESVKNLTEDQKKEKLREIFKAGRPFTLYNFTTSQKETIDDPMGLPKDKAREFVPPIPEVLEIFDVYASEGPAYAALLNTYADYQKMLPQ